MLSLQTENALIPVRSALRLLCGPGREELILMCGYLKWVLSMESRRIRATGFWDYTNRTWKLVPICKFRVLGKPEDIDQTFF